MAAGGRTRVKGRAGGDRFVPDMGEVGTCCGLGASGLCRFGQ